jgi:hypothetical protein
LEDKLSSLKDQLTDLRSAIKSFETEFDQRLDACLQQVSYKRGGGGRKKVNLPTPSDTRALALIVSTRARARARIHTHTHTHTHLNIAESLYLTSRVSRVS